MKNSLQILLLFTLCICNGSPSNTSKYITIDQFGYLPDAQKISIIRDPQTGYDATESFSPGISYQLRNWHTDAVVFTANITAWNGGAEDPSSGDKVWWFDFSTITATGDYYVFDPTNNVGSYRFRIANDVYNEVLKQAVRSFYYQRSGTAKLATHASAGWADAACFVGPLQDKNCRLYSDKDNPATEKDLSGGWFDAGDYNKYTTFVWNVIPELLTAYEENPSVWADNYNIPESGNGIPDLLDEIKWELDWLLKMQQSNGSVLSIVGVGITSTTTGGFNNSTSSPPSATTGQSLYGQATTDATYATAAMLAHAAKVFRSLGKTSTTSYASTLQTAAEKAWTWANANPGIKFRNNDAGYNSKGIGSGQSDKSDNVDFLRVAAACYLFAATGNTSYRTEFDNNYTKVHLIQWGFAYKYESSEQDMLLAYTRLPNATSSVVSNILSKYSSSIKTSPDNLPSITDKKDPYRGYMADFVWGSNSFLCRQGGMYYNMLTYNQDAANHTIYKNEAYAIINKMHGTNPMGIVYLTNMNNYGAENSCTQLWHTWFKDKSPQWDQVGVSEFGPPPGFVPGGPNSGYNKDACCPSGCFSPQNNAVCTSESWLPIGQPKQKSYKDINTNWPLNFWSVTENGIYYQAAYIKLLSKFIVPSSIVTTIENSAAKEINEVFIYPNPAKDLLNVSIQNDEKIEKIELRDVLGNLVNVSNGSQINVSELSKGIYITNVYGNKKKYTRRIVIE